MVEHVLGKDEVVGSIPIEGSVIDLSAILKGHMMPGMIMFTVCKRIPDGWLMCRGQHLKIEEYPELYAAIGFEYGGDLSTTFALPRIPVDGVGLRPLIYTGK